MADNICTKRDFLRLWTAGSLGNKLRSWETYEELCNSGYKGMVGIRSRTPDVKYMQNYVPLRDIPEVLKTLPNDASIFFGEVAPDSDLLVQGEYFHGENRSGTFIDRHLTYSTFKGPMRLALARSLGRGMGFNESFRYQISGLMTELLLQGLMSWDSYEDFKLLQELYPNHTIEFGIYGHTLGSCELRNTIIWEVRYY